MYFFSRTKFHLNYISMLSSHYSVWAGHFIFLVSYIKSITDIMDSVNLNVLVDCFSSSDFFLCIDRVL